MTHYFKHNHINNCSLTGINLSSLLRSTLKIAALKNIIIVFLTIFLMLFSVSCKSCKCPAYSYQSSSETNLIGEAKS